MFNGIIQNIGKIKYFRKNNKRIYLGVSTKLIFKKKDIGCSVSCNGVCLTLVNVINKVIYFYISIESLNRSNLKFLKIGSSINLEKSVVHGQEISGHYVQGHVDCTVLVKKINIIDKTWVVKFECKNRKIINLLVEKASISLNGVSLTISKINKFFFEITIIPHTLKLTNLKYLKTRDSVNLELDIFGKYILKLTSK